MLVGGFRFKSVDPSANTRLLRIVAIEALANNNLHFKGRVPPRKPLSIPPKHLSLNLGFVKDSIRDMEYAHAYMAMLGAR